ncbi:hypothetical protein U0070_011071, partial [Myodes glareolus]
MDSCNKTRVSEFLLLGILEDKDLQPLTYGLFLSMYLVTVFGNMLIILAIFSDLRLHTPMYFFLSNLSFVDICFISTTVPKALVNIQTQNKVITYAGCITQIYFFLLFVELDNFLLTIMAYDRYVAICHPMHYTVIMNYQLCGLLVLVSWIVSVLHAVFQGLMMLQLSFGTQLEIPHYFCEPNQVVQLTCSDSFLNELVMYFTLVLLATVPLAGIFYSYSKIVSSICAISSARGKYKAFSTCASHISVVSLFYCTGLGVYLSSAANHSSQTSSTASVLYTMVTPMLNPFIYSLRNKDVKTTSIFMNTSHAIFCHSGIKHMEPRNNTHVLEFVLLGFSQDPDLQPIIYGIFLSMYLITVAGNMLIILAIISDANLHTPMYFFLSNLSFVDICFTSTTVPKMLVNIQTKRKTIQYAECITQMYFFLIFVELDNFLLAVMAYDRYVAICHPLHYTSIMSRRLCGFLVLVSWIVSVLHALLQSVMVLQLSFCTDLEIPHFFCELNQVAQLTCSDTFLNDVVMYFALVLLATVPLSGILYSYSRIVSSIRAISTAQGKYKAFSTCASHLSVVSLFYCTGLGVYLSSAASHSSQASATASVMYTVVTPMLNPFIYSLRNKDVKRALKRLLVGK